MTSQPLWLPLLRCPDCGSAVDGQKPWACRAACGWQSPDGRDLRGVAPQPRWIEHDRRPGIAPEHALRRLSTQAPALTYRGPAAQRDSTALMSVLQQRLEPGARVLDLGLAAALRAVLIPQEWGTRELDPVALHLDQVLDTSPAAQEARLALVAHLKGQGAQGLLAPTAALHQRDRELPAVRVSNGTEQPARLARSAHVILLWCEARFLPGWCCVPEGRPGAELLPLVRREGLLTP